MFHRRYYLYDGPPPAGALKKLREANASLAAGEAFQLSDAEASAGLDSLFALVPCNPALMSCIGVFRPCETLHMPTSTSIAHQETLLLEKQIFLIILCTCCTVLMR